MKKIKNCLLVLFSVFFFVLSMVSFAFAEQKSFEDTATGKASKALIESFNTFVKDTTLMNGMTDQQKVDYILKQGKERVWKETADRLKDSAKDKMLDYVQARMRADLFKAAVPSMMHKAIVEGKAVSEVWSAADIDIKSGLDTRMSAVKSGLSAAKLGWEVYSAWSTQGADEGCRELGKQIGEKITEYFIPGWGYYRLAQAAVEAIGQYVVTYAFDTALQAKLAVVLQGLDPASNPKKFKDWIMATDIPGFVQKEWDEQLAYSGWYLKGKNNEGENMKAAIITALNKMKDEIRTRMQVEDSIKARLEELDARTRTAMSAVQTQIGAAGKEAQPFLAAIDEFKSRIYHYKKQDYQEVIEEEKVAQERITNLYARAAPAYKYSDYQFDHKTILESLRLAFAEFTDGGSKGYDKSALEAGILNYQEVRKDLLDRSWASIQSAIKAANEAIQRANDTYSPQYQALQAKLCWGGGCKRPTEQEANAIYAQLEQINEAWSNACRPYWNVEYVLGPAYARDVELLVKEEQSVMLEVQERVARMRVFLDNLAQEAQEEVALMKTAYDQSMQEAFDLQGRMVDHTDHVQGWMQHKDMLLSSYMSPGNAVAQMDALRQLKADLEANRQIRPKVVAAIKKATNDYILSMNNLINHLENSIPSGLINIQQASGKAGEWSTYEYILGTTDIRSELTGKLFNAAELSGEWWTIIGNRDIVRIPRVWDTSMTADEFLKSLDSDLLARQIEEDIAFVNKLVTEMEFYDSADQMALSLMQLMGRVQEDPVMAQVLSITLDKEKARQSDMFLLPHYAGFMSVDPEQMKGVKYLEDMKASWKSIGDLPGRLEKLLKGVNKSIKYADGFNQSAENFVTNLRSVPERIALYEETLARVQKEHDAYVQRAFKYLEDKKKKLDQITRHSWYKEKVEQLEEFQTKNVRSDLQLYSTWIKSEKILKLIEEVTAFDEQLSNEIAGAKEEVIKEDRRLEQSRIDYDAKRLQEENELKAREEAERRRQENNFTLGHYQLYNQRINTRTPPVFFGDLVLLPDDLRQGAIDITARLSSIDRIDRMLFSEDNGRTWVELPLNANISVSITPFPDKPYNPVLKIRSTLADELIIPFFPSLTIIYRDLDVQQMVTLAVKELAEAYERADIGAFSRLVSEGFIGNKTFLEEGVRLDFDLFMDIRLDIYINRIEKRGNTYVVETKWNKSQTPRKTGQQQTTTGTTTMVMVLQDGMMKIQNLRGNLLYATLSPEIAQTSGLSAGVIDQIRTAGNERNPVQPGAATVEDDGGVTTTTSTVTLTSPVGGELWTVADSHDITWTTSGSVAQLKIEYSSDGGASYSNVITSSTSAASGSYTWTVPNDPGTSVRVRITDTSNSSVMDQSGSDFSIVAGGGGGSGITILSPSMADHPVAGAFAVQWTVTGTAPYVKLELSRDNGATYLPADEITDNTATSIGPGTNYTWTVPGAGMLSGCNMRMRFTSVMNGAIQAVSDPFCVN